MRKSEEGVLEDCELEEGAMGISTASSPLATVLAIRRDLRSCTQLSAGRSHACTVLKNVKACLRLAPGRRG